VAHVGNEQVTPGKEGKRSPSDGTPGYMLPSSLLSTSLIASSPCNDGGRQWSAVYALAHLCDYLVHQPQF